MGYQRILFSKGSGQGISTVNRVAPTACKVRPPLPGNVIVIHGVNDVGVSFGEVEAGLCAGLEDRVDWCRGTFIPADYRMPETADYGKLEKDPDAVFFKRTISDETYSPVIPFYWGYSEVTNFAKTRAGQFTDRFGNRLDKDFSKGGGPFANATTSLPDMWAKGAAYFRGVPDWKVADPLRPIFEGPGHMYMVLAAMRLANLANVIRAYDPEDMVSVVAHSQGCLISLLAQAFLLQNGQRPIDTLVLTHPPYSLEETLLEAAQKFGEGGVDDKMKDGYTFLSSAQTLNARLQTLAKIVTAAHEKRGTSPWIPDVEATKKVGVVSTRWEKTQDRDNRGKVYLYFCPEDMTVALPNVQGIGWQGVPDAIEGHRTTNKIDSRRVVPGEPPLYQTERYEAQPLKALGSSFLQRVFTAKLRPDVSGKPGRVPVGLPPRDFVLRLPGENDKAHADPRTTSSRASLPEASNVEFKRGVEPQIDFTKREGIRAISGEALTKPYLADLDAGAVDSSAGKLERVDPIDAAISVTSDYGLQELPEENIADPRDVNLHRTGTADVMTDGERAAVEKAMNNGKSEEESRHVKRASYRADGTLRVTSTQSPNEARLHQQERQDSPRSFHSAIFGGRANHQNVTAYDVAIGQGTAASDPLFYQYLCALADWRLKKPQPNEWKRPGILIWEDFLAKFGCYFQDETKDRAAIIEGGCDYYSTGTLADFLPVLPKGLPPTVVCENTLGRRVPVAQSPPPPQVVADDAPQTIGQYMAANPVPSIFQERTAP